MPKLASVSLSCLLAALVAYLITVRGGSSWSWQACNVIQDFTFQNPGIVDEVRVGIHQVDVDGHNTCTHPHEPAAMTGSPSLYAFANVDSELAPNLRRYILDQQNEAFARHDTFRIAVSGGSLPKTLAKALLPSSNGSPDDKVDFSKWHVFYADERCVPLDHEDSNHRLVQAEWLDQIPKDTSKPKVYPIDEKYLDDAQEMADQYEKGLVSVFAARDSVKLPLFDLILLGCGPDGHTCSLFPDHPLLRETDAWVMSIADSPKPPPKRITLSLPVVTHAMKIAFVATGGGKSGIMKKIFETDEGSKLPCGLVNSGAGDKVSWFCDHAAVEGVSYPRRGSLL